MSNRNELPPKLPHPALALGYRSKKEFKSLEEEIKDAMQIMAKIIADDGEEYLPIFARLEDELKKCHTKNSILERALKMAHKE